MGQIETNFKPSFPVFDANVALGRKHSQRVLVDNAPDLLKYMSKSGIDRSLVYSPHSVNFDSIDGNSILIENINGNNALMPQFVWSPGIDNMQNAIDTTLKHNVKSIRFAPLSHKYPFKKWMVNAWLDSMISNSISLFISIEEVEPDDIFEVIKEYPDIKVVLTEIHYRHYPWLMHLLKSLPNINIEISRFVIADGMNILVNQIGVDRVLYGSRFPDSPFSPQLYSLYFSGLKDDDIKKITSTNLENLLGGIN